jgi:predicted O-linked N-acetylglucosamine transferase (SPINDLY family)
MLGGRPEVRALNRLADVYLDALPYSGATSLLDPLLEGVPTVVADGCELRFSQGAAMLRELGCPELIACDEEDYIRLAVRLGADASLRQALRERIRDRMDAGADFLNPRLYARRVSKAFQSVFLSDDMPMAQNHRSPKRQEVIHEA